MSYENLSIAELQAALQDLESSINKANEEIKACEADKKKIKGQLVILTDQHPLDITTPQALFYKTEEGRLKLRSMTRMELYSYFQDEPNQPRTKKQRNEAAQYLMRSFATAFVPFKAINRALQANGLKLAPSYLMIKAWLQAGAGVQFNWKPPGKRSHNYRMLWVYEKESMDEKKRKGSQNPSSKESEHDLLMPLSSSLILELQFLEVLKDRKKSVDKTMMDKDLDLSLCQNETMGCPEMESIFTTFQALNIQNENLSISLC